VCEHSDGLFCFLRAIRRYAGSHRSGLAAALTCAALLFFGGTQAQTVHVSFADDDLRLLEVRLEPYVLSDAVPAFVKGKEVLLPIGELAHLLTLALTVDTEQGTASGYILEEARTFHLDVAAGTVTLAGRALPLDPALIEIQSDDIYAASRMIAQWFPVDLEVDLALLRLLVRAREPLPLQQRSERQQNNTRLATGASAEDRGYPRKSVPYRMLGTPAIDQTIGMEVRRGHGTSSSDSFFSSFMAGDLFGMESTAFLSGRQHGDFQRRITLGRNDPDAELLGPLQASSFAFGSVPLPTVRNIARTAAVGSGFTVSNYPLTRSQLFDRQSFQGDLLPGWDVELYHNGALSGYQQAGIDGRYGFADVPLFVGTNDFRLVFRGPQGQLREERQSFLLGDSAVPAGEFHYRVAGLESDAGHRVAMAQFDWGLTRRLAATTGFVTLPVGNSTQRYVNLGLRTNWSAVLMSGEYARSDTGGHLAELGLKTRLGRTNVGLSHTRLQEFASDVFLPTNDPVSERTELRLDGTVPSFGSARLPVSLDMRYERAASGRQDVALTGRMSGYFAGTWITNQIRTRSSAGDETSDGALQMGRGFGTFGLRGLVNYSLAPGSELTALALAAERRLGFGYVANTGVTRSLVNPDTRYHAGVSKQLGDYGLGVNSAYSAVGELTLSAQFFVALGKEPRTTDWISEGLPMADSGLASVRVFLDENLNGVMDSGEEALEGVGFTVDGGKRALRTNAEGIAYLRRLPTRRGVDLAVDPATLEDPQWSLGIEGVQLVPRAGRAAELDFPVIMTGEIDGSVYLLKGEKHRPVAGVTLELLTLHPAIALVRRVKTASDGFYIVESVPPGEYLLRVASEDLKRAKLADTGTRIITVSSKGDVVSGVELLVTSR
jgi:hypothetical protein